MELLNTWQVFQYLRSPGDGDRRVPRPEPGILEAAYMGDDLSIRANDVVESSAGIV